MAPPFLDLYCERTAPGVWSEPLNTLTNLAFVVVAGWLARRLSRHDRAAPIWYLWALSLLIGCIGAGSAL